MLELLNIEELNWKPLHLNRKEFLIQEGEVERYIYLVKSGALRAFNHLDEEEHTIRFAYTGSLFGSISSYFTGEPSELAIQALRESHIWQLPKADFENYLMGSPERLAHYNSLLKELVVSFFDRELDLLCKGPSQRIERLLKRSPQVFQEVPHKYIASYLRMSPETLSRLINLDFNQE